MITTLSPTIRAIDGNYHYPGRGAAYLLVADGEAAFIDNITRFSVPRLMQALDEAGLQPEQVRYIIVTHIHLDHSGGTAELAKQCPEATVVAHPRAGRHIIDPTRLVESARPIYGEDVFDDLYGEIEPVEASRVQTMEDEETLALGKETLTFYDAPGHAKHHFVIHESASNCMFTGDAYGLCFEALQGGTAPYFHYVCAPPQFDPMVAKQTIERIRDLGPDRVFVTHFGECVDVQKAAEQLLHNMDAYDAVVDTAVQTGLEGDELVEYCSKRSLDVTHQELAQRGLDMSNAEIRKWATAEHNINQQGLAMLAEQRRKAASA